MDLNASLDILKGVGQKRKQLFSNAGIETIGELLTYYPRGYEQYDSPVPISACKEGDVVSVYGELTDTIANRYIRGRCISTAVCIDAKEPFIGQTVSHKDASSQNELLLTWYNMPYLRNSLYPHIPRVFRGTVKRKGSRLLIEQAAVFEPERYQALMDSLQPVYSLTKGLTMNILHSAVRQVLLAMSESQMEYLPEEELSRYHLCSYVQAITQIHFPNNFENLKIARHRLVFDEFFFFLLQLRFAKEQRREIRSENSICPKGAADRLIASLPYSLTNAQKQVWSDIVSDLQGDQVMNRLLQGDVGSGKTIVAVLALLTVAENGLQGALMAPTEVLATQHYDTIQTLLRQTGFPYEVVLLTGSMTAAQKRETYQKMSSGEASIIIGTHALIQERAVYHNLALVITDEQHRFGVRQRERLSQKGRIPHTIVMSATPIPRTLAVILYGDLDISVIDEMPADRLPVKNCVVGTAYRPKAYAFIEKQVRLGHQAYVICPMVEESDQIDAENVIAYTEMLRQVLPKDITVDFLHGRMNSGDKNEIMKRFLRNEIQVLVSTTVIEVGVNVPNATVMMVENAERFGLAQLHQLRGRVGRGSAQSYCIFLNAHDSGHQGESGKEDRLEILNRTNDGFEIASWDLKLRGPGDLFGVRQSGLMSFRLADIYADADVLMTANEAVNRILDEDPTLCLGQHQELKKRFGQVLDEQSVNGDAPQAKGESRIRGQWNL